MAKFNHQKYRACLMGEVAASYDMTASQLKAWLTEADWIEMIKLGYRPGDLTLQPPVVKYLKDKFEGVER